MSAGAMLNTTHMLEIKLSLLSDGSVCIKGRLYAVPQYAHVHVRGMFLRVARYVPAGERLKADAV